MKPVLAAACLALACLARGAGGAFPVHFENLTQGGYGDDRIFVYGLAQDAANRWCRFLPDGSLKPLDPADISAPGHLVKGGKSYANYAFTLSQARDFRMADHFVGGRLYVSLGEPLCFPISADGWGGPDFGNPDDPNADVIFDWYEMAYVFGEVPFGGNTTQVDQFGIPMTVRLKQDDIGYDRTVGIALSRDEVVARYLAAVGPAFKPLAGPYRIVAPRSSPLFRAGGASVDYLKSAIDAAWARYAAAPFNLTRLAVTFSGGIVDGRLKFTRAPAGPNGSGPFFVSKPTSAEVFACDGALAKAGMNETELEMGAELGAAFNRGVALAESSWYRPADYYAAGPRNDYSMFFHTVSLEGRAYGFPYDDVNDQSSVRILPVKTAPSSLTLSIYPIKKPARVIAMGKSARDAAPLSPVTADGRRASPRGNARASVLFGKGSLRTQ